MTDDTSQPFLVVPANASSDATAELVGSKAAQLARMSRLGLPVPPAFVMPTSLCKGVNQKDGAAVQALKNGLRLGVAVCFGSLRRGQVHARNARHDSRRWHEQ